MKALFVILLSLTTGFVCRGADPIDVTAITSNPAKFHGREVVVQGLAHVTDNRFTLFQDLKAARDFDVSKAIAVNTSVGIAPRYNRWWVKLRGRVDAHSHGSHFGQFPCDLNLKDLVPLHKEKSVLWQTDAAVFRNAMRSSVKLKLSSSAGDADLTVLREKLILHQSDERRTP